MADKNIQITVGLDENEVPSTIHWDADDKPKDQHTECKAFMLSLYDKNHLDTLKIDLWTKEMQIAEMDQFIFQSLRGLVDTYFKATQNGELANEMQRFVQYFGEKTGVIKPESDS